MKKYKIKFKESFNKYKTQSILTTQEDYFHQYFYKIKYDSFTLTIITDDYYEIDNDSLLKTFNKIGDYNIEELKVESKDKKDYDKAWEKKERILRKILKPSNEPYNGAFKDWNDYYNWKEG